MELNLFIKKNKVFNNENMITKKDTLSLKTRSIILVASAPMTRILAGISLVVKKHVTTEYSP